MQDYGFIDKYNELVETLSKMIRADKTLIREEDRWLPISGHDITDIYDSGDNINVAGNTWTNQTGGSTERWDFDIPKADIELFQLKQKLVAP